MTIDPGSERMRERVRRWSGAGLVLVGGALLASCGGDAQAGDAQGEAAPDAEAGYTRVVNVEVLPLASRSFTDVIRLTGTVAANRDVVVSAEESGVIREILVEKGSRVRSDEPIAKIDDRVLRAQTEQARARARLAQETWARRKRLWEEDAVGSEIAYLEARYAAEEARANLEALAQRLERTVIRAPIPGTLDSREIEVGTMVSAGTPVARIVELNPVKVTGGVPERFAPDVRPGALALVTFDFLPDEEFKGRISYVGAAVNPRNRTFPVELTLPNPGRMIKPEMVAGIDIVRDVREGVVVAPREALVRVEGGQVAFVIADEDGGTVARRRLVEIGPAQQNEVVIESGLGSGDRLIVVGQQQVADGDRVRVVRTREDAPHQPETAPDPAAASGAGEGGR